MKDRIHIAQGDICSVHADAIICQANTNLEMEEATTRMLMETGGDEIQRECNQITGLEKGKAVLTSGGKLKAKFLIHAVVNEMDEPADKDALMSAMREALLLAKQKGFRTILCPLIGQSDEIPIKRAAELLLTEVKKHFDIPNSTIERLIFVVNDDDAYEALEDAVRQL